MASYFDEIVSPKSAICLDKEPVSDDLNLASFLQVAMRRLSLCTTEMDDQLLQPLVAHLQDTEPRLLNAPPASRLAVAQLPLVVVRDVDQFCAVCKTELHCSDCTLDPRVTQLPCRHRYHPGCIIPWLAKVRAHWSPYSRVVAALTQLCVQYNCCPSCRFELPTDDLDYEARRAAERLQSQPPPPASAATESEVSCMYE